jgi:tRNA pseudouridine38-40 synthase
MASRTDDRDTVRIALKLGYLGTRYHGFQSQPQSAGPTIEGALFEALTGLKLMEDRVTAKYAAAGRTDKGVHALAQVISFDTAKRSVTPRMVNSLLPADIWVYALATPGPGFNARRDACSREYRYFLPRFSLPPLDLTRMHEAAASFTGTHDFSNFAQPPGLNELEAEHYSPFREVKRIAITADSTGSFLILDLEADSFLRKMVRKIVAALIMVGRGLRDSRWVEALLAGELTEQLEPAPACGLILRNVSYPGLTFAVDEYARRRMVTRLTTELQFHATIAEVLRELLREP